HPADRETGPQGCVAATSVRTGDVPDPVRRVWRLLRDPPPQHGGRGLRPVDADPVPDRDPPGAPNPDPRHAEPHASTRAPHHAGSAAGRTGITRTSIKPGARRLGHLARTEGCPRTDTLRPHLMEKRMLRNLLAGLACLVVVTAMSGASDAGIRRWGADYFPNL